MGGRILRYVHSGLGVDSFGRTVLFDNSDVLVGRKYRVGGCGRESFSRGDDLLAPAVVE